MLINQLREYYALSLWLKGFDKRTINKGLKLPISTLTRLINIKRKDDQCSFVFPSILHTERVSNE